MPLPLTVSCFSKIQTGFTFLVPAQLGSPEQMAVKRVCRMYTSSRNLNKSPAELGKDLEVEHQDIYSNESTGRTGAHRGHCMYTRKTAYYHI